MKPEIEYPLLTAATAAAVARSLPREARKRAACGSVGKTSLRKINLLKVAFLASLVITAHASGPALPSSANHHGPTRVPAWIPDSLAAIYQYDDGSSENVIGFGDGSQNFESLWFNQFEVLSGADVISSVDIAWGTPTNITPADQLNGLPVTVVIWSDPNGDGDPADGVLLGSVAGTIESANTDTFITYTFLTSITVPGTSFFVGDMTPANSSSELFMESLDQTTTARKSWLAAMSSGAPVDIVNLGNNDLIGIIDDFGFPGNWLIRANTPPIPTPFQDIASLGPLTHVYIGNELSVQVTHVSDGLTGEFYPPSTIPSDGGTFIATDGALYAPDFSSHGGTATGNGLGFYTPFTPVSQTDVTGSGSATDPFKVVTVVDVGATGLSVQQTDTYIIGDESYQTDIVITNNSDAAASGVLYRAADSYLMGFDTGFGFTEIFDDRKAVGCSINANNVPPDRIEEWIPLTGGNNFYEDSYASIWVGISTLAPFPDTCACTLSQDNGSGISWNFSIPAAGSATFSQATAFSPIGMEPLVTSKTADSATSPPAGQDGYTITIENPNPGSVTLSSITDTLPAGFTYVLGSSSGVTTADPSVNGQVLTWTGSFPVPANGAVSLHFGVIVATAPGDYFNEASGKANGGFTVSGSGPTALITVIVDPPVITSDLSETATVGQSFTYQITGTNNPTSYGASPLPDGLGVDPGTGVISGTPTLAGIFMVTISATNAGGTGTATLTITVNPAPPIITSPLTATATVGQPFTYTITATNNPTSFDATGLPPGLTRDTSSGVISGTPTVAGVSMVTISATNAGGTGTATLTLTVNPAPPIITSSSTATATVGQPFTYTITATNNPTSFDATGLPPGLTRDTSSGVISGTPTAAGIFMVTISATNAGGTGTATLTITVNPAPPVITSSSTATATVGQPFTYTITATNNPTSFDATGLPPGLTRDTSSGVISGTPTADGMFMLTISATNAGGTGMETLNLAIVPSDVVPTPVIISPLSATATVGQFYVYQIVATQSPTSYNATNLPSGLEIDPVLGFISGTPSEVGSKQVTLSATDANGTGTAILTLTVQAAPPVSGLRIISGTSATGRTGSPFIFQVVTSGATAAATLSATGLPSGLGLNPMVPGEISGIPTMAGSFSVALSVTDGGLTAKGTLQLTFTSDPAVPVISSPSSAFLISGVPFSYQIVAESSSSENITFDAFNLPLGLGVDSKGLISGTPMTSFGLLPAPLVSAGVISNVTTVACNPSGCADASLFFKDPTGAQEISTRLSVGTDDNRLIGGFIIQGDTPTATTPPLKLVVRGIGPSLTQFGVTEALANPTLELHDSTDTMLATNDDWKGDSGGSQEVEIDNTGLAPNNPIESAILAVLDPGGYTAVLSGANKGTGVGLVEVYNLKIASLDESAHAHLGNISTRGYVQTGDNVMIGGFYNASKEPMQVLVRAIGPSLTQYGVSGALANPFLELHDSAGKTIETNDDWGADPDKKADIIATGLAPMDPLESAILYTLPIEDNTAYTAIVKGVDETSGVALVEVYFGNPCLGTSCP